LTIIDDDENWTSRELAEAIPEPSPAPLEAHSLGLQVASFLERGRAEAALRRFESWGMDGRIESVRVDGRRFHRVLVGPFSEAADAEGARKRIEEETSFSPILIRHDRVSGEGGG
jgi:cell division septation protein DedD